MAAHHFKEYFFYKTNTLCEHVTMVYSKKILKFGMKYIPNIQFNLKTKT